jgi:co-chaperonin GroES (HSP10)
MKGKRRITKPLGARVIVEDIIATLSIEQRAAAAGFVAIVNEQNRPKATQGKVLAVGTDPLLQEEIKVGDIVDFSYLAGTRIFIDGEEFRSLEFQDIIQVTREEEYDEENSSAPTDSN